MKIKAIGFDIGGTLVNYNKPLNWSASYNDAIKYMCDKNKLEFNEERFQFAKEVLEKYNTRINPREKEFSSDIIFGEIFKKWNENEEMMYQAKKDFYQFFQREAFLYDDVKKVLEYLKENNIKCAVYTDVAYGMDDEFSLNDISEIQNYIDLKLTSINVGYRKPNKRGFEIMLEKFQCSPDEILYIGDEEKDIKGPQSINMKAVLVNRDNKEKNFNQDYTINNLEELINIIRRI